MTTKQIKAVLFDLDGTLIDTAPDMAAALNALLQTCNRPTLAFEQIRNSVSKGSIALVTLGFGTNMRESRMHELQQAFFQQYFEAIFIHSELFPGMHELLLKLEQHSVPWGIVTNKPRLVKQTPIRENAT